MRRKDQSIREYLKRTKMTTAELAAKLGINRSYVSLLSIGSRRPSPELAVKIEEVTGIPFRNLLVADRDKQNDQTAETVQNDHEAVV